MSYWEKQLKVSFSWQHFQLVQKIFNFWDSFDHFDLLGPKLGRRHLQTRCSRKCLAVSTLHENAALLHNIVARVCHGILANMMWCFIQGLWDLWTRGQDHRITKLKRWRVLLRVGCICHKCFLVYIFWTYMSNDEFIFPLYFWNVNRI